MFIGSSGIRWLTLMGDNGKFNAEKFEKERGNQECSSASLEMLVWETLLSTVSEFERLRRLSGYKQCYNHSG